MPKAYRKAGKRQSRGKGLQHHALIYWRAVTPRISACACRITHKKGSEMPHVQITWVEGRSPKQKRNIAAQITQTLETEGRAKRENIHVAFLDVPKTDYAEGGVTVADQKRVP
jgi:4-oxalocrotonate tautomerase